MLAHKRYAHGVVRTFVKGCNVDKMAELHAARDAALARMSPVARGREKGRLALEWVWRWGWSSASTTDLAVSKRRGVAKRLADAKLITHHRCSGFREKYYPTRVIVLSTAGVDALKRMTVDFNSAGLRHVTGEHVAWHQLAHDHAVQYWTALKLSQGMIEDFITPREMSTKNEYGRKNPDAVWLLPDGSKVALELELTPKKPRELHDMVTKMTKLLAAGTVQDVVVVTQSPATARKLQALVAPGAVRARWRRDSQRKYVPTGEDDVAPDWLESRITIEVLP